MKQFVVFTPSELDIVDIVTKNNVDLDIDYLRFLINYVLNGHANFIESFDEETGERKRLREHYVKIDSKKDVLVRDDKHKKHIEFLISNFEKYDKKLSRAVTEERGLSALYRLGYEVGKRSFSYRINPYYTKMKLTPYYLSDWRLINKIRKYSTKIPPIVMTGKYKFLLKYFQNQKLEIDFSSAIQHCNRRFESTKDYGKYLNEVYEIADIQNKVYRFYYTKETDSRLHTNLTMLPSDFRKYLTYDNKRLVEVDLSNSIIFFLNMLISNNVNLTSLESNNSLLMFCKSLETLSVKEIELFSDLALNGSFYDSFMEEIQEYYSINDLKIIYNDQLGYDDEYFGNYKQVRRIAKKKILAMIFAPTSAESYGFYRQIFANKFPELMKIINDFKDLNNSEDKKGHKKLSHILFQLEAEYLLNVVARAFNSKFYRKAPIFTLHDCLITTEDFGGILEEVIKDELSKQFDGLAPDVKTEPW